MRRMGLVAKTVRDVRGATIAVAVANGLLAFFLLAVYPSYQESLKDFQLPDYYRGFVGEAGTIGTAEGYISSHAFIVILVLITLVISGGTAALAGEEGAGTLDLLLAQPVGRTRVALEKAAALALMVTAATLAVFVGAALATAVVDIDIGIGRLLATVVSIIPLVWLFLALSLWGGAALPSRGAATALAVGTVAVAFFLNMIGAMVDMLETPRKLSPFYWADPAHVLLGGFDWQRSGGLVVVAAGFLLLALWSFRRRDLATGVRERGERSGLTGVRHVLRWSRSRAEKRTILLGTRAGAPVLKLARKALHDVRGATAGISLLLFLLMLFDVLIFPQYRETLQGVEVPAAFQAFVGESGSLAAPEGFLAYVLSVFPLVVLSLAIIAGTGALAGDEAAGTLDLILAQPVSRTRVVLERAAGLALAVALATLAMFPGFLLAAPVVDIGVGAGRLLAALTSLVLLALAVLALSLWASAAFPSRAAAALPTAGFVVVTFFLNALGATVDALAGPRRLSPFFWADPSRALSHGFDWLHAALLLALTVVFLMLALWSFGRRDIAAGAREWSWTSLARRRRDRAERRATTDRAGRQAFRRTEGRRP